MPSCCLSIMSFYFFWLREHKACIVRVHVRCLWNLESFPKMWGLGKTLEGVTHMKPSWGTPFVGPKNDSEEPFWIETCEEKKLLFFFKNGKGNVDGTILCCGWTYTMPPAPGSMWTIDNHFHQPWTRPAVITYVDFFGFEGTSRICLNIHYCFTTGVQVKHPMPSCCLSIMSFYFCLVDGTQGLCCEGLC